MPLASLPEELQLYILSFLDVSATYQRKLRDEPSLDLTSSLERPLKNVSVVSKGWRRIVLPLLFSQTRLRLDQPSNTRWRECLVCNEVALSGQGDINASMTNSDTDQYHVDMVEAALERCSLDLLAGQTDDEAQQMGQMAFAEKERLKPLTALAWMPNFYHGLKDFLSFLHEHNLTSIDMQSFVLSTDRMLPSKLHRFPHEAAERDWRFAASAAFWAHLLSVINPRTVTIVAPPTDLACLTNCAIDTFGDWAFGDMDFHILSLTQDPSSTLTKPPSYASLRPTPPSHPSIAPSSLLLLRPWTSLSLNEGSFLKAYSTYEFFERGPPSLITSIKTAICNPPFALTSVTSLSYTAIFPFASHADFTPLLHHLTSLSLQLAPSPGTEILSDKSRIGKAELADCWQELSQTYLDLTIPLRTAYPTTIPHQDHPEDVLFAPYNRCEEGATQAIGTLDPEVKPKRLEIRDFAIKGVREDLCESLQWLRPEHWAKGGEGEVGVFEKQWEGFAKQGRLQEVPEEVLPQWFCVDGTFKSQRAEFAGALNS